MNNGDSGSASLDLERVGVQPGANRLDIRLIDEADGESTLGIQLRRADGTLVDLDTFTLDQNTLADGFVTLSIEDIDVQAGDQLVLNGTSNQMEPLRIDAVEFVPTPDPIAVFFQSIVPFFHPEGGDSGSIERDIALVASESFSGDVTLLLEITTENDTGTETTSASVHVTFTDGAGVLPFSIERNDLVDDGTTRVRITITDAVGPNSSTTFITETINATAAVFITDDDFAPVAIADTQSVDAGQSLNFNPAANDTDGDNATSELEVTGLFTSSINGDVGGNNVTVTLNEDGTVTVAVDEAAGAGNIVIPYIVTDPGGNTGQGD
ncbi:MAG: Ig-like domain-containing protein, partial [Pseudomonadota bacterium]